MKLYDIDQNIIALNTEGLSASIIPGEIDIHPFDAHPSNYILDFTNFHFLIHPESSVSADAQIIITFSDNDVSFELPSPCQISDFGELVSTSVTCTSTSRELVIQNLLREDYFFTEDSIIEFDINNVKLPVSAKPLDTIVVEFYTKSKGVYYLVDKLE